MSDAIIETLQYELRSHMEKALTYKGKIDSARTKAKRDYYYKKLKKNNEQAARILTALENINVNRKLSSIKIEEKEQKNEPEEQPREES